MQKIPVYVISCDRLRERRELIAAHLKKLKIEYELIDAVDGLKLDPAYIERINPKKNMKPGMLGTYLSHLKIYERIVADKTPVALVLEDDTVLDRRVKNLLDQGCANLDFDYCFLGSADHGDEGYIFYDVASAISLSDGFKAYSLSAGPYCLYAYLITLQAANKRLECAIPISSVIDSYHFLPYKFRFKVIMPMLAFLSEHSAIGAASSSRWTTIQKILRKYWWYYPLRDFCKFESFRKFSALKNKKYPDRSRWCSFSPADKVVSRSRVDH